MIKGAALDTGRLVVRPFEEDDADRLVAIFADPDVARHVGDGAPLDRAEALLWVRNSRANLSRHGYGTGAVTQKDGGRMIGWAGVARPEGEPPEIIYGFERAAWRKGYGRELLAALVAFAAARGIDPVRATVAAGNATSSALLLAAGFRLADPHYGGDPQVQLYEWTAST
ncbi:MAG: hypothetical protein CL820_09285 [Croceicoccus sp.]|nr:hypothetical protein [Croceicoccus sp.]